MDTNPSEEMYPGTDWDLVMEARAEDEYGEHYCQACEVRVSSRLVELDDLEEW